MTDLSRRQILAAGLVFISTPVLAAKDEIYTPFLSSAGAGEYDVVAYFDQQKPVKGNDQYTTEYKGAEWYFASQENLDKFKSAPDSFAPQYGGYCAWAVANGKTASGDPLQWSVVNNKLYLNYNAKIQALWHADRENLIVQSDKNWPDVLN